MPLRTISLSGSPREMGRQYGEELRAEAQAMAQTRLDLALHAAQEISPTLDLDWCLALAAAVLCPQEQRMWAGAGNPCQNEMNEYT